MEVCYWKKDCVRCRRQGCEDYTPLTEDNTNPDGRTTPFGCDYEADCAFYESVLREATDEYAELIWDFANLTGRD